MKAFLLLLFFISPLVVSSQTTSDTTYYLQEVSIYSETSPQSSQPASVGKLEARAFDFAGEANPLYALNQLPGVRLEERAPGSYRLSIRGSSLRSPFGVRNVKIYWQGTPLTEANGTTPLNLFDASLYQQAEVIRSPAGSYYGAGTGGALLISSLPDGSKKTGPEAEVSRGSYGYQRYLLGYRQADRWRAGLSYTGTDGYREHSTFERLNAYWLGRFELNEEHSLSSKLLLARLNYDIPGGLTEEQFRNNPKMARPGSAEKDASIDQRYALMSLGHHWQVSDALESSTYFFSNLGFLDHPFNTDYKRDLSTGLGGRSLWAYNHKVGDTYLQWQGGGEYQYGLELARNFGNVNGQPDTLNFDDEIRTHTGFAFLQLSAFPSDQWQISSGLSVNWLRFRIDRLQDARLPAPFQLSKAYDPVLAPRLGLLFAPSQQWEVWTNLSRGFSPPTLEEIRTNEGSLNIGLKAETGTNYELGLRNHLNRFSWELTGYYLRLRETISSYTDASSSVVRFQNAGAADQWGAEALLRWTALQQENWQLNTSLAASWQHYYYKSYRQQENDFSGNALPGVTPFNSTLSLQLSHRQRYQLSLLHLYSGKIPLNSTNTLYTDPYHLLNFRLQLAPFSAYPQLSLFLSGQNMLNERFSLGYDINAFGQRYFQPAPPRQWFVGLVFRPKQ